MSGQARPHEKGRFRVAEGYPRDGPYNFADEQMVENRVRFPDDSRPERPERKEKDGRSAAHAGRP